ncbi:competence/damage-inducible protein A [uncultured Marinococcus sp.]|uniref:competence/damage-inducible protein A n=1 Tax=uncultured Marinococcus sp. TaxID=487012 RepID=UPI002629297C|nr:competence/damage-inducible protein A [uncultured Marinococcus sp.]
MNAEIIAVGTELLLGQIANTNGQYLSKELASLGVNVFRHTVVGDNEARMHEAVGEASERADIVILTGGLGPTQDDITKDVVADFTGRRLLVHEASAQKIRDYYDRTGRSMPASNMRQAHYAENSTVFINQNGMACGMAVEENGTHYILIPGPPREMKSMYKYDVEPYVAALAGSSRLVSSRVLRFYGIGESSLEEELQDLIEAQTNPTIAPLAGDGEVTLRLTAAAATEDEAVQMIAGVEEQVLGRVGEHFYGYDDDSVFNHTVDVLKERSQTIASAESLTGGWFAKSIVDIPGASSVFQGSVTTYSKAAKEHILGIDRPLLDEEGAVSAACAEAMAEKVKEKFSTDVGISFTGVAGPDRDEGKEPGLVWIGVSGPHGTISKQIHIAGTRDRVRFMALYEGCRLLWKEKVVENDNIQ